MHNTFERKGAYALPKMNVCARTRHPERNKDKEASSNLRRPQEDRSSTLQRDGTMSLLRFEVGFLAFISQCAHRSRDFGLPDPCLARPERWASFKDTLLGSLARLLARKRIAVFSDGDVRGRKKGGKDGETRGRAYHILGGSITGGQQPH